MKLVKEHINEKFEEQSDPITDMGIGKVPYSYNNFYVAKHDLEYVSDKHKVKVPKGTVIFAQGGGYFGDSSGKISLGHITKLNGKLINTYGDYDIRKDKDNYVEVYYDVWEKALELMEKLENWFRHSPIIDAAQKTLNINDIYKAIEHEQNVIKKIEKLIK